MQCLKLQTLLWFARESRKIGEKLTDFGLPYQNVDINYPRYKLDEIGANSVDIGSES